MQLPTVLGRVVMVDDCEAFPSIAALTELDAAADRPGAILATLAQLHDYEQALLDLQADTIDTLRGRGWPWKWIAVKFRLRNPGSAWSLRDRRRVVREVRDGQIPAQLAA